MVIILCSYPFRGNVQSFRLMLEHKQIDYTEKFESLAKEIDKKNPYGELPYLINESGQKFGGYSQIKEYIVSTYDLNSKTEEEHVKTIAAEIMADAMRASWDSLSYCDPSEFDTKLETYCDEIEVRLKNVSDFLGNNIWFSGGGLTYVDFLLYELLDINQGLYTDSLDPYENLRDFKDRFTNLKQIRKYMRSSRYIRRPINDPRARVGEW